LANRVIFWGADFHIVETTFFWKYYFSVKLKKIEKKIETPSKISKKEKRKKKGKKKKTLIGKHYL
jgi:hypothetical protein